MPGNLYGVKQSSKTKAKDFSSSTSLTFSSNLASLISSSSAKPALSSGRERSSRNKSDIFTAHNKNVKKRAASDMLEDGGPGGQNHKTKDKLGAVDSAELEKSRRRMEEKTRRYNAMRRGDVTGHGEGLVDFDRKWADAQVHGRRSSYGSDSSDDSSDGTGDTELVEYIDEFGRLRKGTKAAADREERRRRVQAIAEKEAQEFSVRPSVPSDIIYGDTIQSNAFNPDEVVAERMAAIAAKRDKSATPPPETHFDAAAEVRTKGTGFYTFSHDAQERKQQMEDLNKERTETDRIRAEHAHTKRQRRQEMEERKKLIAQQRSRTQADKFLDELDLEPS